MANQRLYPHWSNLTTALRTGARKTKRRARRPDIFGALYADPRGSRLSCARMTGVSRGANMAIAAQFPWAKYKTAADCGTAQGDLIVQVALKNPHLTGIGFDLPEVAPIFEEYVEENGLVFARQVSTAAVSSPILCQKPTSS